MTNYNPIYLCFCRATSHDPSQKVPTGKFPGWIFEQEKIYMQEKGITGNRWSVEPHLPAALIPKFHEWLKKRYLGGD